MIEHWSNSRKVPNHIPAQVDSIKCQRIIYILLLESYHMGTNYLFSSANHKSTFCYECTPLSFYGYYQQLSTKYLIRNQHATNNKYPRHKQQTHTFIYKHTHNGPNPFRMAATSCSFFTSSLNWAKQIIFTRAQKPSWPLASPNRGLSYSQRTADDRTSVQYTRPKAQAELG